MNPEEEMKDEHSTTLNDEGMRDQNNCKSYHKLVKNYLLEKKLVHLFDEYEVEYHTRYYFIVALIFIKYYLKQDFNEAYAKIVEKELHAQHKKITKRQTLKEKLEKEAKTKKLTEREER